MGQSWTSFRRRDASVHNPVATTSSVIPTPHAAAPTVPPSGTTPLQDSSPFPPPPPPLPPPPPPHHLASPSYSPYSYNYYPQCSPYPAPPRPYHPQYPPSTGAAWWPQQLGHHNYPSSSWMPPVHTPPPYVESQQTKTVKNDVNVHKETIQLVEDEELPNQYLVSFIFDAAVDGSITIFYFAKEGQGCMFHSVYPELCKPRRVGFQKGPGQKFCQPSGSSIDLGFFELHELSNAVNDVFPLVIWAQAGKPEASEEEQKQIIERGQITLAVIDRKGEGLFQVKVMKQILLIDGQRYELQEIFGLGSSNESKATEGDEGKDCVICLTEPRDTTVLPCRHMCMCNECAKALRLQTNKCPICRQPVEQLMEIKVNIGDQ